MIGRSSKISYIQANVLWFEWFDFLTKINIGINSFCKFVPKNFQIKDIGLTNKISFELQDQNSFLVIIENEPSESDIEDAIKISNITNKSVVFCLEIGMFELVEKEREFGATYYSKKDSILCKCTECGKYWFGNNPGCWECRSCGVYDGDHYIGEMIFGNKNTLWSEVF